MFFRYLREKAGVFLLLLLFGGIFALVFSLFDLNTDAVGYATALCAAMLVLWIFLGYRRFAARCRRLLSLREEILLTSEHLPPPDGPIAEAYTALITRLGEELKHRTEEYERRRREEEEYDTVWVHQIKTPISAMRLLLGEKEDEALSEELFRIEQYVDMVMIRLRLGSESSDYLLKEYNLDAIARASVRKFAPQFIRKKLRIDYRVPPMTVLTDEKWLSFVIEQLLSNALKYTRQGTITLSTPAPMTLEILDTGVGIRPEDLPRVFEKGYTGMTGRLDKRASGIGLYLCRQICRRLGHGISVESCFGVGTAVRITFGRPRLPIE